MPGLFHYTDASGLLGILRNSTLRASDQRFLNDAQEAIYGQDLFQAALKSTSNPALVAGHPLHEWAEGFGEVFDRYKRLVAEELGSPKFSVYVACFCESGDLLSQWRAYGSDHGYAIEVRREALEAALEKVPTIAKAITQVRYGGAAAASVVSDAMQEVSRDTNLGHVGVHAHYMALRLTGMLAAVKHPGFEEEREWRLIAAFEFDPPELVRFRASAMAVIPYIEIGLPSDAIISVRVGPGRYVAVREQGVRRLLQALSSKAEVLISEVPLRT